MKHIQLRFLGAIFLCSSLLSCKSIDAKPTQRQSLNATSEQSEDEAKSVALTPTSDQPVTQQLSEKEKSAVFRQVLQQKQELGLCKDSIGHTEPKVSEVYSNGQGRYLVKVLCFTAAYQGAYELILGQSLHNQFEGKHSGVLLAGYPTFDEKNNILSNDYKLNGAGSCIQSSQYHWNGDQLNLISSIYKDGTENGCQDLGVRSPAADQLITSTSIGSAKLGMTLGELRQLLPSGAEIQATQLGVDMPPGLRVSFGPEVQYDLAFNSEDREKHPITDQSKIEWIIARHPSYRTVEGVGPGTPLKEAVLQYSMATLGYNHENESRESIEFAKGPFPKAPGTRVWIRSNQWTVTDFAGLYPDPEQQTNYQQTQNYRDHAAIGAIAIYQLPEH